MRALAFDHFFDQDLAALRAALEPGERLDVIGYQRLHRTARRHFDADAFTGVAAAYHPDRRTQWQSYIPAAEAAADRLAAAYRPDVFIAPTDAIFYLRPVIDRLAALGCPTVVVQKETTISPMVMSDHAKAVAESVPFVSAAMTVCSERQRQFWVNAGTHAELITVTGQPRFDVYADAAPARTSRPTILYFSYDDVAYLPSDTGVPYDGSWAELRRETEECLAELARSGWQIVAKRHPQQPAGHDWLGPQVERAPQGADTRHLILAADVVVGFQTTALFEAAAAGRPVVYAAWGSVFDRARPLLIPFHDWPELVTHVSSGEALTEALRSELPTPGLAGHAVIEDNIGPVDGHASARALDVVRRHLGRTNPPSVPRPSLPQSAALNLGASLAAGAARLAGHLRLPQAGKATVAAAEVAERATEARSLRRGAG